MGDTATSAASSTSAATYPDQFAGGLLLHDGEEVEWIADRILAVPWTRVV